jgi:cell division transport system permease protein
MHTIPSIEKQKRTLIIMAQMKKRIGGRTNVITTCISTTMVLILLGAAVFFVTMARNFSNQLRSELPVAVLLKDSISAQSLQALQTELKAKPCVQAIRYISKEEGKKEIYASLNMKDSEFIEDNPILAEIELRLKGEYTTPDFVKKLTAEIKKNTNVADVVYPLDEIESINNMIPIVGGILLSVAALLTFITFALINNTMRMSIYSRRFLIHSMRLVGARWGFIRRPFMRQAFGIGFLAALLAGGLLYSGIWYIQQMDSYLSELVTQEVIILTMGSVLVCGLFLTLICAFFSVNRFLRMRSNDLFLN